jgi:hypothetical protein
LCEGQWEMAVLISHQDVQAAQKHITTLMSRIQSLWDAVVPLCDPKPSVPASLRSGVQEFVNILLRIMVRLRTVQALRPVKSTLAVSSVQDILLEETQALEAARTALQVRFEHGVYDTTHSAPGYFPRV